MLLKFAYYCHQFTRQPAIARLNLFSSFVLVLSGIFYLTTGGGFTKLGTWVFWIIFLLAISILVDRSIWRSARFKT